ncbi:N-acetylneuraminate synthase family protein [Candidatus Pelagibacter sp.]|uniref:N-acetylneuraminate synthase family protein n=1 Tax=Candidatus Pelagibacter sp. TaxID=2024849 RepID=UPI003F85E7E4
MNIRNFFTNYSNNNYTYIIAEACDNHFGELSKAKKMVVLAKKAGADCIKFQHHLPDEEMLPKVPKSSNFGLSLYEFLKRYSLKLEDHIKLKKFARNIGIQYLCTPFSYKAAYELYKFVKVDCFKIGSGELTDIPSLIKISKLGKPMILSTGMSTKFEISRTYKALKNKTKLSLMHCVSEYPTYYNDLNLKFIGHLKKKYKNIPIGYSDHTNDIYSSIAAVSCGARIIEKHVILNKNMKGPDQKVSIDFEELKKLVKGIRLIENSFGNNKKIHHNEKQIREWATRSIVTIQNIDKGTKLSLNNIWTKRPGTGIPSYKLNSLLGRVAIKNIKKNQILKKSDFK